MNGLKQRSSCAFKNDTGAQIGIGTLIIFIAMILIASVAAAVMIQTAGVLKEQAAQTGTHASHEVSSNVMIRNIEGHRANSTSEGISSTVDLLKINVGLHVGTRELDVGQTIITVSDGSNTNTLVYAGNDAIYGTAMANFGASASSNLEHLINSTTEIHGVNENNSKIFFTANKFRDEDGSFTQNNPLMNKGDLISFYVSTVSDEASSYNSLYGYETELKSSGLEIEPRTRMQVVISSEYGPDVFLNFYTPSSYGVNRIVGLYP